MLLKFYDFIILISIKTISKISKRDCFDQLFPNNMKTQPYTFQLFSLFNYPKNVLQY